ncbi:uncharacterized protein LOC119386954 [Rhipicephalus sanguineus]|uniref:uncharacterized protein LOC119386954 n=1 Tax=Rhipicephalus sanguineus TaxID=34632 RepID=UPI00189586BB|nr:uncharacterized protein LOC119386954 [Rhipicephalus sanguineus]
MWRVFRVVSVILGVFVLPFVLGKAKHKLQREIPDSAKVFGGFQSGLALFDIDEDGDLDCVSTVQEDYDESVPSVTYVWLLKGINGHEARNISFYVRSGDAPDEFLFKDKNDNKPLQTGRYIYSDYKDCLILEMPYQNSQECMLWISWEVKDNIPKICTDYFEDNCEDSKISYDEATCSPFFQQKK